MIFGIWGLTNSIRPFSVHQMRRAMLPAERAQKLSPSMNVELVAGQEVFGRYADGVTSQPYSGYPRWVTENIGHLGNVR